MLLPGSGSLACSNARQSLQCTSCSLARSFPFQEGSVLVFDVGKISYEVWYNLQANQTAWNYGTSVKLQMVPAWERWRKVFLTLFCKVKKKKKAHEAEFFSEKCQWGLKWNTLMPFLFYFIFSSLGFALQRVKCSFLDQFAFTSIV